MQAKIIDGKAFARGFEADMRRRIGLFEKDYGMVPGLAVILVGDNPASQVYVRNKERACRRIGMHSEVLRLPADTSEQALFEKIDAYNANPAIHGLLVQFPVPAPLSEERIVARILPGKDVDGLTVENAGRLFSGREGLVSCTPRGVIELIKSTGQRIAGRRAVVVGRSNLVGKPVALLLLRENATVTLCHSRTENLAAVTSKADILVSAVGRPGFLTGAYIKEGAVVIDVGTSRVEGKLKGDVCFSEAVEKAAFITPVPGGVGPMTIAMLLDNTILAAQRQVK